VQGGSEDAAVELYRRYAKRLLSLARARVGGDLAARLDAEDIVQSVFGSFFRGAQQGYYEVPSGEDLWRLFLVIALNKIRAKGAYHRAAKRAVGATAAYDDPEASPERLVDEGATPEALQLTIDEALDRLPEGHRQAVGLRTEGYEVAEIAARTGRSKRTVERLLQEARQKLAFLLEGE
jgi:RNA polymerase sigma-70 factor (ECF subfamily)